MAEEWTFNHTICLLTKFSVAQTLCLQPNFVHWIKVRLERTVWNFSLSVRSFTQFDRWFTQLCESDFRESSGIQYNHARKRYRISPGQIHHQHNVVCFYWLTLWFLLSSSGSNNVLYRSMEINPDYANQQKSLNENQEIDSFKTLFYYYSPTFFTKQHQQLKYSIALWLKRI